MNNTSSKTQYGIRYLRGNHAGDVFPMNEDEARQLVKLPRPASNSQRELMRRAVDGVWEVVKS
jgi:hypothetical protein